MYREYFRAAGWPPVRSTGAHDGVAAIAGCQRGTGTRSRVWSTPGDAREIVLLRAV